MLKWITKIPYWYLIAIPLLSIGLGAASNQVVLWANHDQFPVMYNNEKIHQSCQTKDAADGAESLIAILTGKPTKAPPVLTAQSAKDPDACENGGIFLDDTHVIMTKGAHLKWLSDVWDFGDGTYSIGDGFLAFGSWMLSWAPLAWLVLVIRKFIES